MLNIFYKKLVSLITKDELKKIDQRRFLYICPFCGQEVSLRSDDLKCSCGAQIVESTAWVKDDNPPIMKTEVATELEVYAAISEKLGTPCAHVKEMIKIPNFNYDTEITILKNTSPAK